MIAKEKHSASPHVNNQSPKVNQALAAIKKSNQVVKPIQNIEPKKYAPSNRVKKEESDPTGKRKSKVDIEIIEEKQK